MAFTEKVGTASNEQTEARPGLLKVIWNVEVELDSRDSEVGRSDAKTEGEGRRAFEKGLPPPLF